MKWSTILIVLAEHMVCIPECRLALKYAFKWYFFVGDSSCFPAHEYTFPLLLMPFRLSIYLVCFCML